MFQTKYSDLFFNIVDSWLMIQKTRNKRQETEAKIMNTWSLHYSSSPDEHTVGRQLLKLMRVLVDTGLVVERGRVCERSLQLRRTASAIANRLVNWITRFNKRVWVYEISQFAIDDRFLNRINNLLSCLRLLLLFIHSVWIRAIVC